MAKPTGFGGRDYPDFGVGTVTRGNIAQVDIAELAARLGSPINYDRQGKVVAFETFNYGITGWAEVGYPVTAYPIANTRFVLRGPYSIKCATTADSGSYSGIRRSYGYPYPSRMGIEFHFKAIAAWEYLYLETDVYDGTDKFSVSWQFNENDNELKYMLNTGAYTVLDELDINRGSLAPFNAFKVVFDIPDEEYAYARLNERYYDLARVGLKKLTNTTNALIDVYLLLWTADTEVQTVWIDNIVITMDEPK
jgi:hypothetical protein